VSSDRQTTLILLAVLGVFSVAAAISIFVFGTAKPAAPVLHSPSGPLPSLAPRSPQGPGPIPSFAVTLSLTWDHSGTATLVCWTATTAPAQPNAPGEERIDGPRVISQTPVRIGTDDKGVARGAFVVDQLGRYTVGARIGSQEATGSITIDAGPGPRPCGA
jgi:hypothetical protein